MRSFLYFFVLMLISALVCGKIFHCKPVKPEVKPVEEPTPKCQKYATYNACGPNPFCFPTCGGPRGPACREGCNPGCFCNDGYILNVADGMCIKIEDCKA